MQTRMLLSVKPGWGPPDDPQRPSGWEVTLNRGQPLSHHPHSFQNVLIISKDIMTEVL